MDQYLQNNQHYIILIIGLVSVALLILSTLIFSKSSRLTKSMLVNKFKMLDMNEKNESDNAPLYTVVISNNSLNAISIASLGFEHRGDFFNYRNECKKQLESKNQDLVILPRGSIKLRLYKEQLENAVFTASKTKKLGKIRVYIVGLGGESYVVKTKVIGKKMRESYKEYYAYHEPEVVSKFIASYEHKVASGVKIGLIDKLKYKILSKRVSSPLPQIKSPEELFAECPKESPIEKACDQSASLSACEIENPSIETTNEVYSSAESDKTSTQETSSQETSLEQDKKD